MARSKASKRLQKKQQPSQLDTLLRPAQIKKTRQLRQRVPTQSRDYRKYYDNSQCESYVQRLNRSKKQRMYLIKATRLEGRWDFVVQGFSGNQYEMMLSTTVSCACPDFQKRHKPCKHLFFIFTQVAQSEEFIEQLSIEGKMSKLAYELIDEILVNRLTNRKQSNKSQKGSDQISTDQDCPVCFEGMKSNQEDLQSCGQCKKYFHGQCLRIWLRKNDTCPLCRFSLASKDERKDPLSKVMNITI